jgi:hypothetical protein
VTAPVAAPPRDPALPQLALLTDRDALGTFLARLPWLGTGELRNAALRLRWKPRKNARLGAVLETPDGPAAVLIAAFAAETAHKAARIAAAARHDGLPAHCADGLVVVPDRADPDLGNRVPAGRPLAYNPVRRWVGRVGDEVVKIYVDAPPAGVAALHAAPPRRLARYLPPASVPEPRRAQTAWVEGRPPVARDMPAIEEALRALHSTPPPTALPVLDAATALVAARRAAGSVALTLPDARSRLARLVDALWQATWPATRVLVHGDLSPDQIVVTDRTAVLLDFDRAAVGPAGWDAAQWTVAQLATGGPPLPPLGATEPVLVLAAALQRAPEPFRRLRPDWAQRTEAVLAAAEAAAGELA